MDLKAEGKRIEASRDAHAIIRPPHSPTPIPVLAISDAAGAKAISQQIRSSSADGEPSPFVSRPMRPSSMCAPAPARKRIVINHTTSTATPSSVRMIAAAQWHSPQPSKSTRSARVPDADARQTQPTAYFFPPPPTFLPGVFRDAPTRAAKLSALN